MKKAWLYFLLILFGFSACINDFEELDFITVVNVIIDPVMVENNTAVSLTGRFEILGEIELSMIRTATYGLIVGSQANLSDGTRQGIDTMTLNLEAPFTGKTVVLDPIPFPNVETGQTYYYTIFVEIDNRVHTGDTLSFGFNWLPKQIWTYPADHYRADPVTLTFDNNVFFFGGNDGFSLLKDALKGVDQNTFTIIDDNIFRNQSPMEQADLVGFELNGSAFVGLGLSNRGETLVSFLKADLSQESLNWQVINNFPQARVGTVAFSNDQRAFVGTGKSFSSFFSDFYEYDSNTDQWMPFITSNNPPPRSHGIAFVINNVAYVGLGRNTSGLLDDLWSIDLEAPNPQWQALPSMPGGSRTDALVIVLKDKAVIGMGSGENGLRKDLYVFNPQGNTWMAFEDFPGDVRRGAVGFSLNNKGYIGLGLDEDLIGLDDFWEFDIN